MGLTFSGNFQEVKNQINYLKYTKENNIIKLKFEISGSKKVKLNVNFPIISFANFGNNEN